MINISFQKIDDSASTKSVIDPASHTQPGLPGCRVTPQRSAVLPAATLPGVGSANPGPV